MTDKLVLLTGASRGIGRNTQIALPAKNWYRLPQQLGQSGIQAIEKTLQEHEGRAGNRMGRAGR